ncbi:MAG: sodium-dependent transporter [Clostridia bacterium]|nr:sodium-dependent transporter [Clostridia bacterium]
MSTQTKKSSFSGGIGFVLAAAGSAVGLGNLWRFPTLASKYGGGLFLLVYLGLVLTFGFSLLMTDIAIGRKTGKSSLDAYKTINPKWNFLGKLTFVVPSIIITYYVVIGGWILKYIFASTTNLSAAADGNGEFFTAFTSSKAPPIFWMLIFLAITAFIVFCGVEKGIERFSKIIMPVLFVMIIGIALFVLFAKDETTGRTGWKGFLHYVTPRLTDAEGKKFTIATIMQLVLDAMSQLFFSLSVAMGIMITYGSYVKKDVDLGKSVKQIEIFDTLVAFLAGMMVVPATYIFSLETTKIMTKGGPGVIFIILPQIFEKMGAIGKIIAPLFFVMVAFAALTSSVSILEAIVGSCAETFKINRKKICLIISAIALVAAIIVCLGFTDVLGFIKVVLPNDDAITAKEASHNLLDILDYISNYLLMPIISLLTCILIGWVVKPKWVIDEVETEGVKFGRKKLYAFMIKYAAPVVMILLILQSLGAFKFLG